MPSSRRALLSRNVLALGAVSLLTDVASEMIYPLLPVFLAGIATPGGAAIAIGAMDGIADLVAAWVKLWSGRASDRWQRRKPLAIGGYALSACARPLAALALAPWHVVAVRALDRIGKGVRGAPRDVLLAESVPAADRGLAFSFHRMMDHAGAFAGPLLAAALLAFVLGGNHAWGGAGETSIDALRVVFAAALVPGLLAVIVLAAGVRESAKGGDAPAMAPDPALAPALAEGGAETKLPSSLRRVLVALVVFALGNSTDLFLVFDAHARLGLGAYGVLGLWVWLHLAKVAFSLPGGWVADRISRRAAILAGWAVYALCYASLAFAPGMSGTLAVLFAYGAFHGLTEGAEKALVADLAPPDIRGRAFGIYHAALGLAALPASVVFGVLWASAGRETAFLTGAALAALAAILLLHKPRAAARQ